MLESPARVFSKELAHVERGVGTGAAFAPEAPSGPDWDRRATRAQLNCIENLPVFGAIVMVASFAQLSCPTFDKLALAVLAARVVQTSVHVAFVQTERAVSVRFSFYAVQLLAMIAMAVLILGA